MAVWGESSGQSSSVIIATSAICRSHSFFPFPSHFLLPVFPVPWFSSCLYSKCAAACLSTIYRCTIIQVFRLFTYCELTCVIVDIFSINAVLNSSTKWETPQYQGIDIPNFMLRADPSFLNLLPQTALLIKLASQYGTTSNVRRCVFMHCLYLTEATQ